MDNWDAILWLLIKISILSLIIERGLYVIFEWALFEKIEDFLDSKIGLWFDIKPPISMIVGIFLSLLVKVDLVAMLFPTVEPTTAGMIVTGLYIAGGSKAIFIMFDRFRELRDAKVAAQTGVKGIDMRSKDDSWSG